MFLEDYAYTAKELASVMGVSYDNFRKYKEKFLNNLGYYFTYEVNHTAKGDTYTILEKKAEYQPPMRKNDKKALRDTAFVNAITEIIKQDNIQSAANIADILCENEVVKSLGLSQGSIREYTKKYMKHLFGSKLFEGGTRGQITFRARCRKDEETNKYIPLTSEEWNNFVHLYRCMLGESADEKIEIIEDYNDGLITEEEMKDKISHLEIKVYNEACFAYKKQWGYRPVKIAMYELAEYDNETGEVF